MFRRPAARKRIGWLPFCVRRVWSISSASLRNPPTTITTRRFPRSWTRCGSQDRRKINEEKRRKTRQNSPCKRKGHPVWDALWLRLLLRSRLVFVAAEEERQNFGAFLLHGLEFAGIDA